MSAAGTADQVDGAGFESQGVGGSDEPDGGGDIGTGGWVFKLRALAKIDSKDTQSATRQLAAVVATGLAV